MKKNQKNRELQIHRLDKAWSQNYSLNDFLDGETPLVLDPDDKNVTKPIGSRI
jgi:ABC-type thiamine transport system substrate-binding protein